MFPAEAVMSEKMLAKIIVEAENFPGSAELFLVREHFKIGISPNIRYIGENVRKFFYDLVVGRSEEQRIFGYILGDKISGDELVRQFGRNDGLSFVVAWHFLRKQPFGGSGFLLTNGMTNIFLDSGFSIGLFWWRGGWSVRAYPAGAAHSRIWFKNNQVILIQPFLAPRVIQ
jgi:hypothetical protein